MGGGYTFTFPNEHIVFISYPDGNITLRYKGKSITKNDKTLDEIYNDIEDKIPAFELQNARNRINAFDEHFSEMFKKDRDASRHFSELAGFFFMNSAGEVRYEYSQ